MVSYPGECQDEIDRLILHFRYWHFPAEVYVVSGS